MIAWQIIYGGLSRFAAASVLSRTANAATGNRYEPEPDVDCSLVVRGAVRVSVPSGK